AEPERGGRNLSVNVPAWARLWTVQIPVRIDPDHTSRTVDVMQARERPQGNRVVTAEHDREEPVTRSVRDEPRDPLGRLLDLRKEAGLLVPGLGRLGHRRFDVSEIDELVTELVEPGR